MKKGLLVGLSSVFVLAGSLFVVSACGSGVKEVSIDDNYIPQTTFVQGNELDLSKGRLNVDGALVKMTDSGVTVSGYDKDKLGEQTLTITYRGKEVKLNIEVVPRFEAQQKYVYFLNEDFEDASPRITVYRDDGSNISIYKDYSNLTWTDFDTSEAAETVTISLEYNKDSDHYTGTMDIEVCDPVLNFTAPSKRNYGSHETTLDTTRAALTITNKGNTATRQVPVSEIEFRGFDPAKATAANTEDNPLKETVTAYYNGQEIPGSTFEIEVVYSDVSRFKDFAKTCPTLADWNNYEPYETIPYMPTPDGVTEADGKEAFSLIQTYLKMTKTQREFITDSELENVFRLGIVYGYNTWFNAIYTDTVLSNVFTISASGNMIFTPGDTATYENYKAAIAKLANDDDKTTALLNEIGDVFADQTIWDACGTVNTYDPESTPELPQSALNTLLVAVKDHYFINDIEYVLQDAVDLYDVIDSTTFPLPADHSGWLTAEMTEKIACAGDKVNSAYSTIVQMSNNDALKVYYYDGTGSYSINTDIFYVVNSWRNDTLTEVVSRYYVQKILDTETSEDDLQSYMNQFSTILQYMPLPKALDDLSMLYVSAYMMQSDLSTSSQLFNSDPEIDVTQLLLESTNFIFAYNECETATEEFINTYILPENGVADSTYAYLYTNLLSAVYSDMYSGSFGYLDLMGASAYDDTVIGIWSQYIKLWNKYIEDEEIISDTQFKADVKTMFEDFAALKPIQQKYFLDSLNYLYSYSGSGVPSYALFSDTGYLYSYFANFIYDYYLNAIGIDNQSDSTETSYTIFLDLMVAIEAYANEDIDSFGMAMEDAIAQYGQAAWVGTTATKEKFDAELKSVFDIYCGYYNLFNKQPVPLYEKNEDGSFKLNEDGEKIPVLNEQGEKVYQTDEDGNTVYEWVYDDTAFKASGYEDEFQSLYTAISNASLAMMYIDLDDALGDLVGDISISIKMYIPFFASYAELLNAEKPILESGNQDVLNAYYNMPYGSTASVLYSESYKIYGAFDKYLEMLNLTEDMFTEDLLTFLRENANFFWTATSFLYPLVDVGDSAFQFTAENVTAFINDFLALTPKEQMIITSYDPLNLFVAGLIQGTMEAFGNDTETGVTDPRTTLLTSMLSFETYYVSYSQLSDEDKDSVIGKDDNGNDMTLKQAMAILWNEIDAEYKALTAEQKTSFDSYFLTLYNHLAAAFAEISTDDAGSSEAAT